MIHVILAETPEEFHSAKRILSGFPDHQRMRYAADLAIVEQYFDQHAYNYEMDQLQAVYSNTGGCVLVAFEQSEPVGAVCLKKISPEFCEMKRLFVPILHRRKGIGRKLAYALLDAARELEFTYMRLDTGTFMLESHALYQEMGFKHIDPYYEVPDNLRRGLYFMELEL